ncbi:hypothetical protein AJ78_03222 [Emergomyces pasteurianus Ep9510]|uniref:Probable endonuclease LCL3 n=1 Tax=Emergomyces pasteurianus Ep9510 TaxID=1447872 RepID=A0A1J9PKM9_9EURO|nr:hypothetical protein AJ78_03222 [Emergomyces pasteurianus Ep9510]
MRWLFWSSGSSQQMPNNENNAPAAETDKSSSSSQCANCSNTLTAPNAHTSSSSNQIPQTKSSRPPKRDWNASINARDWAGEFKDPRNLIPTLILTGGILLCVRIHRQYLRRIPVATNISPTYFHKRSLFGRVTSVGDGDNFRMFHTPGGRLAGWGWLPFRKVPTTKKELKDRTIHIRLAGIDAPELPHFGRPAQPFAQDAHTWLTTYLLNRRVRAHVYRQDQYGRVVATVYVRRWPFPFIRRDVGLQMLRAGLATVYEAKSGVEFGGEVVERRYRRAEERARRKGKGLWKGKGAEGWESPREYKTRMTALEGERAAGAASSGGDDVGTQGEKK